MPANDPRPGETWEDRAQAVPRQFPVTRRLGPTVMFQYNRFGVPSVAALSFFLKHYRFVSEVSAVCSVTAEVEKLLVESTVPDQVADFLDCNPGYNYRTDGEKRASAKGGDGK